MDFIDHRSTANFKFGLSSTDEKVRITSDGDVGIGLSNPSTKLEVDGTVTADDVSLATKAVIGGATPRIELFESDTTDVNTRFRNTGGTLQIQSTDDAGTTSKTRMTIDHATGDISFREDSGSNAKFYWDASAESLGIGTSTPSSVKITANNDSNGQVFLGRQGATQTAKMAWPLITAQGDGDAGSEQYSTNQIYGFWYQNTGISNPASETLGFRTNSTERMRIDSSGHLIVPNGVTLGTSVGTYVAANTLDDYEEGTWDPIIADATSGGNTGTAATLDGAYTKVGRQVTVTFRALNIDTTGMTSSNNLVLRNLPFTSGTGVTGMADGSVRLDLVDLNDSACNVTCSVGSSGSVITFRQTVDNGNDSQIAVSAYNSGTADILGTLTYFTN